MNVGGTFHLWLFVLALDMVKDYPNRTERVLNFTCDDHVMSHQNIINAYLALVYPDSYVRVEFIEVDRLRTCINVTEHSLSAHVECSNQDVANANAKLLYRYKAYAYYKEERAKQRPKKIGVIKPGYQPSTITWIYPEFDI